MEKNMKKHLLTFLVASVAIVASGQQLPMAARKRAILPMHKMESIHHAVSQPLEDLPIQFSEPLDPSQVREQRHHTLSPGGLRWTRKADPLIQPLIGPPLAATIGLNFAGLGSGKYGFVPPVVPPDTDGAVGTTQYVQWVNRSYAVFNKSTGSRALTATG
jgi:hypothetical protein